MNVKAVIFQYTHADVLRNPKLLWTNTIFFSNMAAVNKSMILSGLRAWERAAKDQLPNKLSYAYDK